MVPFTGEKRSILFFLLIKFHLVEKLVERVCDSVVLVVILDVLDLRVCVIAFVDEAVDQDLIIVLLLAQRQESNIVFPVDREDREDRAVDFGVIVQCEGDNTEIRFFFVRPLLFLRLISRKVRSLSTYCLTRIFCRTSCRSWCRIYMSSESVS